jgi:hypothetical protein
VTPPIKNIGDRALATHHPPSTRFGLCLSVRTLRPTHSLHTLSLFLTLTHTHIHAHTHTYTHNGLTFIGQTLNREYRSFNWGQPTVRHSLLSFFLFALLSFLLCGSSLTPFTLLSVLLCLSFPPTHLHSSLSTYVCSPFPFIVLSFFPHPPAFSICRCPPWLLLSLSLFFNYLLVPSLAFHSLSLVSFLCLASLCTFLLTPKTAAFRFFQVRAFCHVVVVVAVVVHSLDDGVRVLELEAGRPVKASTGKPGACLLCCYSFHLSIFHDDSASSSHSRFDWAASRLSFFFFFSSHIITMFGFPRLHTHCVFRSSGRSMVSSVYFHFGAFLLKGNCHGFPNCF